MDMKRTGSTWMIVALLAAPAAAQFKKVTGVWDNLTNPDITISVEHPPSIPLRVHVVAFGEATGDHCASSLQSRVMDDFFASGVELVDRSRLNAVIDEQRLQGSALFDQEKAAEVGRLLGADALIFLEAHACKSENSRSTFTCVVNNVATTCYKYITKVIVRGQLRTIDLTTGRVLASKRFSGESSDSNTGGYPPEDPVAQRAEEIAAGQIRKMFFPWSETKKLVFYDDKDCNLKVAHSLLRAQDVDGALRQSEDNLATCKSIGIQKPKIMSHAYYNLGMMHVIQNEFERGIEYLTEAAKLHGSETITKALAEARNAHESADQMARYEVDQAEFLAGQEPGGGAPAAPMPSASAPRSSFAGSSSSPAPPSRPSSTADSLDSLEQRLAKLEELYKKGLINKQDYDKKKAEILAEL